MLSPRIIGHRLQGTYRKPEARVYFVVELKRSTWSQAVSIDGLDWGTAKKAISSLLNWGLLIADGRTDIDRNPHAKYVSSTH